MSFRPIFTSNWFPSDAADVPFRDSLTDLFFKRAEQGVDFAIHGPNIVRMCSALLTPGYAHSKGLLAGPPDEQERSRFELDNYQPRFREHLEAKTAPEFAKTCDLLGIAALYHDLGKTIRRANHPQIGVNLLRHSNEGERSSLVDALVWAPEPSATASKHNRFSLVCSIVQHHDKFGVVSTGEAALPIFSDILYFTSDYQSIEGIRKNVTSVMLVNLADIAAVCRADAKDVEEARRLATAIYDLRRPPSGGAPGGSSEADCLDQLIEICEKPSSCLGLKYQKILNVLGDWDIVVAAVDDPAVKGNRGYLKSKLLEIERNPARAIVRIERLLREATETAGAAVLRDFISPTSIEAVLVGALGAHQFQSFCEQLATVVKLDYALSFFKAIVCACVRKRVGQSAVSGDRLSLSLTEAGALNELARADIRRTAEHVTALFVKVLNGLVSRYSGVIGLSGADPRRFGFQLRNLTGDERVRDTVLSLLCYEDNKEHIALTWIADEVTIWSMD